MEKITKKKDLNKEKINEILEKYNLKAPKKTQISDKNNKTILWNRRNKIPFYKGSW